MVEAVSRRLKGSRPHVVEDLQARAEAIGDPCRLVDYCVRRGESAAVGEPALVIPHAVVCRSLCRRRRLWEGFPIQVVIMASAESLHRHALLVNTVSLRLGHP